MTPRACVLLNPAAGGGNSRERLDRVLPSLRERYVVEIVETSAGGGTEAVGDALSRGVRAFIAAGGDGTVGRLVNDLAAARGEVAWRELTVGAVGLGSSNDFHKPFDARIAGVPVAFDAARGGWRDVARAEIDGQARWFVVSASLGITAAANARFNAPDAVGRAARAMSTDVSIVDAAVRTLLSYRPFTADIAVDGEAWSGAVTNLSVSKTPWLSGFFRYDVPIDPGDGHLAALLCHDMGRARALWTLFGLARGRFVGQPGTRAWRGREVVVRAPSDVPIELDGEVFFGRTARFTVAGQVWRCR